MCAYIRVIECVCVCVSAGLRVLMYVWTATPTLMFVVAAFLLGKLHKCNGIYI